ncbi:hypothetical protein KSP39_PZI018777 [Platanthera zijinensis]|uniref:Uncharacterized protein n=1 Tax=Platanthera zijinensis TaxID=2320716 RepID=A0AAP0B3W6_9ASPA
MKLRKWKLSMWAMGLIAEKRSLLKLNLRTSECKPEGWILSTCDVNRFWAIEGSHGRSRVWVDPPHHHVNCRFDISDNYSSPKFPLPGSRNAAAAAVANVKRNGFVNAPDGTLLCGLEDVEVDYYLTKIEMILS